MARERGVRTATIAVAIATSPTAAPPPPDVPAAPSAASSREPDQLERDVDTLVRGAASSLVSTRRACNTRWAKCRRFRSATRRGTSAAGRSPSTPAASGPRHVPPTRRPTRRSAPSTTPASMPGRPPRAGASRSSAPCLCDGGVVEVATEPGVRGNIRIGHFGYGHVDARVKRGDRVRAHPLDDEGLVARPPDRLPATVGPCC